MSGFGGGNGSVVCAVERLVPRLAGGEERLGLAARDVLEKRAEDGPCQVWTIGHLESRSTHEDHWSLNVGLKSEGSQESQHSAIATARTLQEKRKLTQNLASCPLLVAVPRAAPSPMVQGAFLLDVVGSSPPLLQT